MAKAHKLSTGRHYKLFNGDLFTLEGFGTHRGSRTGLGTYHLVDPASGLVVESVESTEVFLTDIVRQLPYTPGALRA